MVWEKGVIHNGNLDYRFQFAIVEFIMRLIRYLPACIDDSSINPFLEFSDEYCIGLSTSARMILSSGMFNMTLSKPFRASSFRVNTIWKSKSFLKETYVVSLLSAISTASFQRLD